MIALKSLAAYKNRPALVSAIGEKVEISLPGGESLRVREKDLEILHPGPAGDLASLERDAPAAAPDQLRSAWELMGEDSLSLRELAELVYGAFTPAAAWAAWGLLQEGLYFSGSAAEIRARSAGSLAAAELRRGEKERGLAERGAFLDRLRRGSLNLPDDRRFLQDTEALARGQTGKSRTLKELGRPETPLEAHRLLLAAGVWTGMDNPHPSRFGLSLLSPGIIPPPPPEEERRDLTGLRAFAIDNPWSDDPDDAVSLEGGCLWVHVADPAASIFPGSPADLEARGRGATLYLPEGPSRMMAAEALPLFALGLGEVSPALSFRLVLNRDFSVAETEIFPSLVKVTRLSYGEADALAASSSPAEAGKTASGDLAALFALGEGNLERRLNTGAVNIELPEVHISLSPAQGSPPPDRVKIGPVQSFKSAAMVRECMILAGEGAAKWALQRRIPFPFISQEAGDLPPPEDILPGLAGSWQLRRCMRPRQLSVKPGVHWGLGLDEYTQVTSPLRRYTDLLAHQQIRAFLRGTAPQGAEELPPILAAAEAASSSVVHAERASRAHWTAVYLSDKKDSPWDGVAVEKKGNRTAVLVPALGLETQVSLRGNPAPNEPVRLVLSAVRIPEGEAVFSGA